MSAVLAAIGATDARTWELKPLAEVADILDGKRIPVNAKEREKRSGPVPYYGATSQVGWIDDFLFNEELVLLGEDGAPFLEPNKPKAYVIRGKSWVNNHAHVLRARAVPTGWLAHYLNVVRYDELVTGTTRLKLTQAAMRQIRVPVAPWHVMEQRVAEIEKQFSRLDEAVANLKRVKANLRNLRSSALNAACEGPWPSIEFGLLARETLVGLDRGRDQQRSVGPGHRYVKMNIVSMDGEIQSEGIVYVDASSQEATKYALRSGDILFNTRNSVELVGKSALVPPELEGALYNNNLMRIRTTPEIDSAFLAMQMCAPAFRRQLEKVKRATTSVAAIYLKDLVRVPVIVPPVTEQCHIVAEVESRLSIIREVAAEADRNSQRAQALRQAILQRAFAGEPEVRIAA
ncbi:MAG: restriction endonuclease subunit S [Myxococcales bacterium]|nr:restriction endonuclease subunit S [Myxococcales bacterium]